MARLTDKQWAQLIEFYDRNHTMLECAEVWKVSEGAISRKFKRIGKKARPKFVPTRRSRRAKLPDHHYMKNVDPPQVPVTSRDLNPGEDPVPQDVQEVRLSRKRKIVSLKEI